MKEMEMDFDVGSFIQRSLRVLRVSHRPRREEFWTTAKTVVLGMVVMGVLGVIITFLFAFIDKGRF